MKILRTALALLFLCTSLIFATAQNLGDKVNVTMRTGSSYNGELIEMNDEKLIIKTDDFGTITLRLDDINDIEKLSKGSSKKRKSKRKNKEDTEEEPEEKKEEVYWYKNPSTSHYMFGSTGYSLKKNEMEIQSIWVVFNTFKYGVTDQLTLGAGLEILNLVFNNSSRPGFGLTAQYAFPIRPDEFNVSANAAYFNYPEDKTHIGVFYGSNTIGNRESNATIGIGFIVSNGISDTRPLINFGGMIRVGQKLSLITENWLMPPIFALQDDFFRGNEGYLNIISFGARHVGKHIVANFSILLDRQEDVAIPWISLTIPFSK